MKAIVLAGGYATRLWPLTKERAKPLLLVNGKPLLTHIVDKIPKNIDVMISTNITFRKDFEKWSKSIGRDVEIIYEKTSGDKDKLGALGAITECIKSHHIEEDLLIVGGDNYFHFSITEFLKGYKGNPLIACYDIREKELAKKFGVMTVRKGKVLEFKEKPKKPKSTLVNIFCCIIPKDIFPTLSKFVETYADNQGAFVAHLLKKEIPVNAYITKEYWYDIGSFEGYLEAHQESKKTRKDDDFDFFGTDFVGKNTIEGKVFIDKGTIIKNSKLRDCIVLSDCLIEDSTLENCIIDEQSRITNCTISQDIVEKGSFFDCRKDRCVRRRVKVS